MPTFANRVDVPYRPDQLFDLVADVGRYPEFLPWCVGAVVRSRTATELVADLTIGFGPFRETFTSRVTLEHPTRIRARYENGPFRYLNNQWVFTQRGTGAQVDFWVDFEFRNRMLQAAIGAVFSEAVKRMVSAFLKRARDVYGAPPATHMAGQGTPSAALPR
jgi:coenzyme Q-binding protein COQ10